MFGSKRVLVGGILVAAMLAQFRLEAGALLRNDEDLPASVMQALVSPDLELPETQAATWQNLLQQLERSRGRIRRPAVLNPKKGEVFAENDLGDHFLEGFRRERGLRRKLSTLADYRIQFQRTEEWVENLGPEGTQLQEALGKIRAEVDTIEAILIEQMGEDLLRGGRSLGVAVDHLNRAGLADQTAETAFGGLVRGLKRELTNLASSGSIDEASRSAHAEQLQIMEELVQGQ